MLIFLPLKKLDIRSLMFKIINEGDEGFILKDNIVFNAGSSMRTPKFNCPKLV